MEHVDLTKGYEYDRYQYTQSRIGVIAVERFHFAHTSESSLEIIIHVADGEKSYGREIFNGTLEQLIERLERKVSVL